MLINSGMENKKKNKRTITEGESRCLASTLARSSGSFATGP